MRMPRKWIERRAPSALARCVRIVTEDDACHPMDVGHPCGFPLVLFIGPSPMPEWETIVVERCPEHIRKVSGVLLYVPESWADEGPHGL